MKPQLIHQFVESENSTLYGRLRTHYFLEEYFLSCCNTLPLPFEAVPIWTLPPSIGWEFISQNRLGWVLESDDNDSIISEFQRGHMAEIVRKGITNFLRNKIPGPLIVEGVFSGEDMGISLPVGYNPKKYLIDPDGDMNERVLFLENAIKYIWAIAFISKIKRFMTSVELPKDNWMMSVAVTDPLTSRRGSYYYPDMTASLIDGGDSGLRGYTVGGWWEPFNPMFPRPVKFIPGQEIGPGDSKLLAMKSQKGEDKLHSISRHLAKTHGTMNLTIVKDTDTHGSENEGRSSLISGKNSPFSIISEELISKISSILGEPSKLQITLQPDRINGNPTLLLNSVVSYIQRSYDIIMPKPEKNNVKYLFNNIPVEGTGSTFVRYFIKIDKVDTMLFEVLDRFLTILSCEGEGAMIIYKSSDLSTVKRIIKHDAVLGLYFPDSEIVSDDLLFNIKVPFNINLDGFIQSDFTKKFEIFISPKPVKIVFDKGMGTAWV